MCALRPDLQLQSLVENAELAVIPNADHFTMAGQFDIAAMVLLNFMQKVTEPN